jgi:hypothetical protein
VLAFIERGVPDVSVTGNSAGPGLLEALLGTTLKDRVARPSGT